MLPLNISLAGAFFQAENNQDPKDLSLNCLKEFVEDLFLEQSFYQKCLQQSWVGMEEETCQGLAIRVHSASRVLCKAQQAFYSPLAFESTCQRTIGAVTLSNKLGPAAHCLQNQTHKCR